MSQNDFDCCIGKLDRILSLLVEYGREAKRNPYSTIMDLANRQTLKHHAEDMIAASEKILRDLGEQQEGTPQSETSTHLLKSPEPLVLRPMRSVPKDGRFILLFGESGYVGVPLRCEVCRYDKEFRPLQPWVTYAGDSFEDTGGAPTAWIPMPPGVWLDI